MKLRPLGNRPEPVTRKLHWALSEALDQLAGTHPNLNIQYASVDAMGRPRIILAFSYNGLSIGGEQDFREQVQMMTAADLRDHIIDRILTAIGENG